MRITELEWENFCWAVWGGIILTLQTKVVGYQMADKILQKNSKKEKKNRLAL